MQILQSSQHYKSNHLSRKIAHRNGNTQKKKCFPQDSTFVENEMFFHATFSSTCCRVSNSDSFIICHKLQSIDLHFSLTSKFKPFNCRDTLRTPYHRHYHLGKDQRWVQRKSKVGKGKNVCLFVYGSTQLIPSSQVSKPDQLASQPTIRLVTKNVAYLDKMCVWASCTHGKWKAGCKLLQLL